MIYVTALGILLLILEVIIKKADSLIYWTSMAGVVAVAGLLLSGGGGTGSAIASGGMGILFCYLFLLASLMTIILSRIYLTEYGAHRSEYYILIIFSVVGMMMMALSTDLIMLFVGLELMSICLYILAGFLRVRLTSNESALKYFLLGAFITGFILYGIALIYGSTGSVSIATVIDHMSGPSESPLFWTGVILVLAGFSFKVGAFPFHMWIPDVYQGAATPVTAFMATGAKTAAFSVLVLVFSANVQGAEFLRNSIIFMAAGSMIIGNLLALMQDNIKRMLAYSSIAHAGYMLVGIASGNALGREGVVFYLIAYLFMNLGALGIVSVFEGNGEKNLLYGDYAGLSRTRPLLSALMAIFLFSLAGLPPFGGFFGKYFVFVAAIRADLTWLAILGVMASLVGVYYYLRLVMVMYFHEGEGSFRERVPTVVIAALAVAALINLQIGILPSSVISLIQNVR